MCVHYHNWLNMVYNMTRLAHFINKCKYTSCYWDSACLGIFPIIFIVLEIGLLVDYVNTRSNIFYEVNCLFVWFCISNLLFATVEIFQCELNSHAEDGRLDSVWQKTCPNVFIVTLLCGITFRILQSPCSEHEGLAYICIKSFSRKYIEMYIIQGVPRLIADVDFELQTNSWR